MEFSPAINNFSGGEIGPLASARTDLDRYKSTVKTMQNFFPMIQGPAKRREGTKYVASTKSNAQARLESFIYSNEQAYVLEFGDLYIRFYSNGGQVVSGLTPVEVVTPYSVSDVFALTFCQSNDVLYIFHPSYAPRKLIRYSDTNWQMYDWGTYLTFYKDNYWENMSSYIRSYHGLCPSAVSGSITINVLSFAAVAGTAAHTTGEIKLYVPGYMESFYAGDYINVASVGGTTEANGDWYAEPLGGDYILLRGSTYTNAWTAGGQVKRNIFQASDIGRYLRILEDYPATDYWVYCQITAVTNAWTITAKTVGNNAFDAANVGAAKNHNTWQFAAYSATTGYPSAGCFHEDRLFMVGPSQYVAGSGTGDYENFLEGDTSASAPVAFGLNSNDQSVCRWVKSDERGLLVGTSSNEWIVKSASVTEPISPTSITAKKVTNYGSPKIQPVQAGKAVVFVQANALKLREFNYFYDVDGFRCQDLNQLAHHITESGITQIALAKTPEQMIYAVRSDGALAAMNYERDGDGLRVGWSKHIFEGTDVFVESVATIPQGSGYNDQVWFIVRRTINGAVKRYVEYIDPMSSSSYSPDYVGSYQFLDCSIGGGVGYALENLTFDAVTHADLTDANLYFNNGDAIRLYCTDSIGNPYGPNLNIFYVANVDASGFDLVDSHGNDVDTSQYTFTGFASVGKLITSFSGLGHLEGLTVGVFSNGVDLGDVVVSAGAITLQTATDTCTVGIRFKSVIKINRLEGGSAMGTSQGRVRRPHKIGMNFYETLGVKFGPNEDELDNVIFLNSNDTLENMPELFTGIQLEEINLDYGLDNDFMIYSDSAYPCTLLAILPQVVEYD